MNRKLLYLLGLVGGLGVTSSDIYLSCLPKLSNLLQIDSHALRLTFSCYFIAMALSSLMYGSVLRYLDKSFLYGSMICLFCAASIGLSFALDATSIAICRVFQGVAFGVVQPLIIASIKFETSKSMSQSMASYGIVKLTS